jgi:hypothetical protein
MAVGVKPQAMVPAIPIMGSRMGARVGVVP